MNGELNCDLNGKMTAVRNAGRNAPPSIDTIADSSAEAGTTVSTARAELTLLIPGLAGPDAIGRGSSMADSLQAARALTEAMELPGLSALLEYARDEPGAFESPTADGLLAEAFSMARDADGQWSAAAVVREGALGDAQDRHWIRADPIHLRADMGRLLVFPPATLDLDLDESSAICEWLNSHEHFPGPRLDAISGTCWLAEVDAQVQEMRTFAPSVVHGQHADQFLPAGEGAARWHARMNEIQMLLNQCPINQAREARGEAAVNSVWFWGAGALPSHCLSPSPGLSPGLSPGSSPDLSPAQQALTARRIVYTQVHGNHDLLAGLAACMGLRARALPADGARWLSHDESVRGAHLLVLDDVQLAACGGDVGTWQLALHTLEQQWLQPLADALHRGVWQRITIHIGRGAGVQIRRPGLLRWLRRRRGLAQVLARMRHSQAQSEMSHPDRGQDGAHAPNTGQRA
ncbi:MAG: hypothetical protein ACI8W7_000498 [Gammaproteobacteria bacterium]